MKNLKKYIKKPVNKSDCIQTSVSIERKQKDFVDSNNLNLSEMVRDMLDETIKQNGEKEDL